MKPPMEASFRLIDYLGTRWPIPNSWAQVAEGVFQGEDGLLKLIAEDGGLIDPGRCLTAQQARSGEWTLVGTDNGLAVSGRYVQSGAHVLVYRVRADLADLPEGRDFTMPEVQATYVLASNEGPILSAVQKALGQRRMGPDEYGTLDGYGHAALGPVPLMGSWLPVGDFVDNSGKMGTGALGDAYSMLVGGGWLVFTHESKCCGALLEPLGWRLLNRDRAVQKLQRELAPKGLIARLEDQPGARVWRSRLSAEGISYVVRDAEERLRGSGAFFRDGFGQAWRVHYWLHPEHGKEAAHLLEKASLADSSPPPAGNSN